MSGIAAVYPSKGSEALRSILAAPGNSLTELSYRARVPYNALSSYVHGDNSPSLENAFRMQKELGIPAGDWREAYPVKKPATKKATTKKAPRFRVKKTRKKTAKKAPKKAPKPADVPGTES
jgi:transcriptional regulator with XRE-family HTH domain